MYKPKKMEMRVTSFIYFSSFLRKCIYDSYLKKCTLRQKYFEAKICLTFPISWNEGFPKSRAQKVEIGTTFKIRGRRAYLRTTTKNLKNSLLGIISVKKIPNARVVINQPAKACNIHIQNSWRGL